MVNIKRCLLLYLLSWSIQNIITMEIFDNESIEFAEITLYITQKHLRKFTSTLVVVEKSVTPETTITNLNLLECFLQNTKENISIELQIQSKNKQPWEYYILIVDSIEAFRIICGSFPKTLYERRFNFLIILTKFTNNFTNVIEEIFTLCYQLNVIDVIIILKHPTNGICLFTYILYSKTACRTVQPILYLKLNRNYENLKIVFPEKLTNFYGCPINVSGRKLGPFMDLVGNTNNPQPVGLWENLSGVEGLLIKELASTLNFKLQLLPFTKDRSYVDNLKYFHGSFLDIKKGKADIAIGGYSASDPNRKLFSQSYVYHSSPFIYIVRGKELSPLGRLAKPFSNHVWMILVLVLIIGFLFTIILRLLKETTRQYIYGDDNEAPTLNLIAIILGYSVNRTPSASRNFARYVLLLLLLLTLVIRNAYQGSMYDAIRRDAFLKIPSGYKDIVKWNYKILISPEVGQLKVYPKNMTVTIPSGGYLERIKILETIEGRYASAVLRDSFIDYMKKNNWKQNNLFMNNEIIIMYHFVMFFPKHSIYLTAFNKKLRIFTYAGITNKLKFNLTTEAALRSITRRQPPKEALGIKRLRAMYDIYICINIVAIVVFCLELVSVRFKWMQRVFKWIG